jgi:hypothetical protein
MKPPVDGAIHKLLLENLLAIESKFDCDVFCYYGPIVDGIEKKVLEIIEDLVKDDHRKEKLLVILTTNGGSAIAVERFVNIIRHHYKEVDFLIPDYAYSAGTIFCMSGDNIHMDYFSALGPIDPQVQNKEGKLVAALGYLDKVNELIKKAQDGSLTQAEFLILKDMDLAELRGYEQAKELTIDLLKRWLVKYKFKNWDTHNSDPLKKGSSVSEKEKIARAEEIAGKLGDNKIWKSHGRPFNIEILEKELKLNIKDYSNDEEITKLVRSYYAVLCDFIQTKKFQIFLQTRKFI